MKIKLLLMLLCLVQTIHSQIQTPLLILSNKNGKLIADGSEVSEIKKDIPYKIQLEEGEHIIQITSNTVTLTEIVTCIGDKQKVLKMNFENVVEAKSTSEFINEKIVTNSSVSLPGIISDAPTFVNKYYAFNKGDNIKFSFNLLNKKGTINFYLYSYPDDQLIFSKEYAQGLEEQSITINKKGVYRFVFSTNHILDRDCEFLVKRIPDKSGGPDFNTNVVVKWDTTYYDVLDTQVRVYSSTNLEHNNRTTVKVNLPEKTTYWVYWIGVGQESVDQMSSFMSDIAGSAAELLVDPIYAFGIGLIGELPMFNSTATVNYVFADNANSALFFNSGENYYHYSFKKGNNVTTDYSKISTMPEELNICLWNNSILTGHDVQIKVGAFAIEGQYVPEGE